MTPRAAAPSLCPRFVPLSPPRREAWFGDPRTAPCRRQGALQDCERSAEGGLGWGGAKCEGGVITCHIRRTYNEGAGLCKTAHPRSGHRERWAVVGGGEEGVFVMGVVHGAVQCDRVHPVRDPTAPVAVGTHGWVTEGCRHPPQWAHDLFWDPLGVPWCPTSLVRGWHEGHDLQPYTYRGQFDLHVTDVTAASKGLVWNGDLHG